MFSLVVTVHRVDVHDQDVTHPLDVLRVFVLHEVPDEHAFSLALDVIIMALRRAGPRAANCSHRCVF